VFGFHGCHFGAVDKIIAEGFDHRVTTARAVVPNNPNEKAKVWFGYFGSGVYVAENASKSDEYTVPQKDRTRTMFLVRACLGIPFQHRGNASENPELVVLPGRKNHLNALLRPPYIDAIGRPADSVYHIARRVGGDETSWPQKNSEFIVYDRAQVYPELLITFRRLE
jgi:hypothetical protein